MTVTLTHHDKIAVLDLGGDENRFSPALLDQINAALDTAASDGSHALLTTASGKFYSNGLDLEWLSANGDRADWYVGQVQALLARVLAFPLPTAAALPGHAFGAGAMLAIAHDFRVMRTDRGYFCFPEADIRIPFTKGMAALIQSKLTPKSAIASMTTGHRFPAPEALAYDLIDATAPEAEVTDTARGLLTPLGAKDPGTFAAIKHVMFADAVAALTTL
ncbi:MAG: enoyl-CoA hydratase [Nocardia sp.]|uniref:enoyl-CoA hydratase-related protein n=1 Tax=Nocardia sp. TaxID=1821 RepID=UPI00261461EC|nr:enoyl-CoA hydratase-related protein [Nocardia sp.]MCU1643852.1 enoyl-CoA hydratase [Nocardia sp.]